MTVGVGGTIKSGILRSIEAQNPDRVVLLFTRESREKHGDELIQEIKQRGIDIAEWVFSTDESEADQLLFEYLRIIKNERKNGRVRVDITFGTKTMTSALYSAGLVSGLEVASYVEGRRDSDGRVIPGSERLLVIPYELSRIAMSCKRLVELYNSHYYGSALQIAEQIAKATSGSDTLKIKTETLYRVCRLAYLWDKFDFEQAFETVKTLSQYKAPANVIGELFGLPAEMVQEKLKDLAGYLNALAKGGSGAQMNPDLVWELVRNADRRASNSLWDDAVARLYRAVEYIGQLRLHEIGLFDGEKALPPKDNSISLPPDLRKALGEKRPLGLKDLYRYLSCLGDEFGNRLIENGELKSEIGNIISKRNKSILAHGFKPVGRDAYEKMRELVLELVSAAGIEEPRFDILKLNEDLIL